LSPGVASLEGTAWRLSVTPDKDAKKQGEKPFSDTLTITEGLVTFSACAKHGFLPSSYSAAKVEERWAFKTNQVSPTEGRIVWIAKIEGRTIQGKMVWAKPDGTLFNYTFTGTQTS